MTPPRRIRWGFIPLAVILVGLVAWLIFASRKPAAAAHAPSVPVSLARVSAQDVALAITEIGAAQAWQGVLINPQVNGKLLYVAPEGVDVAKGALLAQIDPRPYQAALTQAQGTLRKDQAALLEAQTDLARYQALAAQDSISRQQYEDQIAVVKQDQGVVETDQGAVAAAQVNLDFCRITSPVAGRVGVRLIDPGNIVSTATTSGIVSVNEVTPIAVTFTVPEGDFERLSAVSDGFSKPLTAQALSQETGASLGFGELVVADNHVDQATGTVEMKARFENVGRQLWPGQFVNVRLTLQTVQRAITVPEAAINEGPHGAFVYLVGAGNKVSAQPVSVLTSQDGLAVIKSGLSAGQTVVTDGQMSLRPGLTIHAAPPTAAAKPAS